jgi:hypothetical protein
VADGINTAMKPMQAAGLDAAIYALAADPRGPQLLSAHHAVLPGSDACDHQVAFGAFLTHMVSKAPTSVLLPFFAGFRLSLALLCRFSVNRGGTSTPL